MSEQVLLSLMATPKHSMMKCTFMIQGFTAEIEVYSELVSLEMRPLLSER